MSATLIDTHAHLDFRQFDQDRDAVLAAAAAAGVACIVNPGVDPASTKRAIALARAHPGKVYAAAGIHPMCAGGDHASALAALAELARDETVVAVGETGLDLFKNYHPLAEQRAFFAAQLRLAVECELPVIIHCRDAFAETLETIRGEGLTTLDGVMHCFSGGPQDAEPFLELGLHVGFTNNITYPRAVEIREAAARLPLERIVVETDCPYLPPQKLRGKRCEPAHTASSAAMVAALRGVNLEEIARATTANARRLFPRIPPADA